MNNHEHDRPIDELDDSLRRAVEVMRGRPLPLSSMQRALDSARRIDPPMTRAMWRGAGKRMLAVAGFAAAIVVCCWFFDMEPAYRGEGGSKKIGWSLLARQNRERLHGIDQPMPDDDPAAFPRPRKWAPLNGDAVSDPETLTPEQFAKTGAGESFAAIAPNVIGDGGVSNTRTSGAFKIAENESPRPNGVTKKFMTVYNGQKWVRTTYTLDASGKVIHIEQTDSSAPTSNPVSGPAGTATSSTPSDGAPRIKSNDPKAAKLPALKENEKEKERFEPEIVTGVFNQSAKEIKDLSENWGTLPERERAKALEDLTKGLPPQQRQALEQHVKRAAAARAGVTESNETKAEGDQKALKLKLDKMVREEIAARPSADRAKALMEDLEKLSDQLDLLHEGKQVSAEDRRKLADLGKELPPKSRELIDAYLKALGSQPDKKAPKVWHRDRQRPSFARVYVGDGNALELVSQHVTVNVEGPRARTFVDHIFRNPHARQLEGTFEYPLPTGASASYYAMFIGQTRDTLPQRFAARNGTAALPADAFARFNPADVVRRVSTDDWGNLQEARIVSKQRALETYEDIVRGQIDPALLEYSGGNTFTGRVFPIPPKGYNRVLIAYEELLPVTQDQVQYRFALPDCKLTELQFTVSGATTECRNATFRAPGAENAAPQEGGNRVSFNRTWKDKGPGGDVLFAFTPPRPEVQVISGRQGESGPLHFYARLRPQLKVEEAKPFAEHAVLLLDTSLSEHPDRFDVNMKLLRKILESDESIKRFNILTFDVAARWLEKGWLDNSDAGRKKAFERLDGIVLEGATNLSAALEELVKMGETDARRVSSANVFLLSDGQITWGESAVPALVARFESRCKLPVRFHCYRTGIGADNVELFEALTRRGGGIFNCYGEADLPAVAVAHRHQCFQVERVSLVDGPETSDFLVAGRKSALYPGGELIVAGRAGDTGKATIVVEGAFLGEKRTLKFPVEIDGIGELAPRGWAEIAVAALLSLNDPALDSLVTAYCQQYGVGSKVASFLILENDNEYKRLNLEAERGKTVPGGDLGVFLDQTWKRLGQVLGPKALYERFLAQRSEVIRGQRSEVRSQHVERLVKLLGDADFALPEDANSIGMVYQKDVPITYLAARSSDRRDINVYVAEARRRANGKDAGGAVRALSSIIEEYPARADALRLVGYRLLDLKQASQASRLFRQVQESRPFEPHSYRDLARGLEEIGCFGLAGLQYEVVLAGSWHNRFRGSFQQVGREEYVRMMRLALTSKDLRPELADFFGNRLEELAAVKTQSDLRVTISWNTDATDVDLWVIEPDGTKCFYSHKQTKNGGELSEDLTQGFGPERYQARQAIPGVYTVIVHYCGVNRNLLAGETHVHVVVTRHADTPDEQNRRYNVILKKQGEQVEVCKVKFE